jgi:hypothetical protein
MPDKTIKRVLQKHTKRLMLLPGVVGVAQGEFENKPCIKVYVTRKSQEVLGQVPSNLEGYRVIIEESGKFQALDK